MNFFNVLVLSVIGLLFTSCGGKDYNNTGKDIYHLYTADAQIEGPSVPQQMQEPEFIIDNSIYIEDVAWDYSPRDDMNVFGDNNSQLELEFETDAPPRLQFKDRQFP
ncbi:MAG: hypothetical protein CME64_16450 [Halobacteriovoraceae bacterium]|nr:hypothetical protein [Halobacteriovoraceae bacterium]|tara:strand:+ start:110010 stop:110330 length:321 start_codon:yes stop_codon:yes gene_type:complete